ncbi:MAG: TfpX/TfpZ family type IV pilin accessory protein [Burkholderiales bacterium]|nr:TfpX/TfpZ family type IV pilin accessory protein [Burkholderiales bacterium]
MALSPRLRAFSIHLACSALVAGAAALFVSQIWYPSPLLRLLGGFEIFLMLIAIDVVLGPTITLIIAKPGKSRLALSFDYTVIGAVQLAALIYGMNTLAVARPAFITFAKDGFLVVRANDVSPAELAEAKFPEFQSIGIGKPRWALAELPTNLEERNKVILDVAGGGRDYWGFPKYYRPMQWKVAADAAKPLDTLRSRLPAGTVLDINYVAGAQQAEESALGFVPFIDRSRSIAAVLDRRSGEIVGYAWHSPW